MKNGKYMKNFMIGAIAVIAICALVFIGCPADGSGNGNAAGDGDAGDGDGGDGDGGGTTQMYDYVCPNGTAASGQTTMQNQEKCTSCKDGYNLESEACVSTSDLNANQILLLGTWESSSEGTLVFTVGAVTHGAVTCTTWGVREVSSSTFLSTSSCSGGTSSIIADNKTTQITFSMMNTVVRFSGAGEFTKKQ